MLSSAPTTTSRYVVRDPKIYDGEPTVVGTRVAVRDIVRVWKSGLAPEQISDHLLKLVTTAQVFDALSFYFDNQAEIDEKIAWYKAHPLLDIPVELRCYPYWDEMEDFLVAYRRERNAKQDYSEDGNSELPEDAA